MKLDLTGKSFGKLTVIERVLVYNKNGTQWLCQCNCGKLKTISAKVLMQGRVKSCGANECSLRWDWTRANGPAKYGGSFSKIYAQYKTTAHQKGLVFTLNYDVFYNATQRYCYYCGCQPSLEYTRNRSKPFIYNGIDRIDNSKGYTLDNIVTCCKRCNIAKNDMTKDDFLNLCRAIAERHRLIK